MVEVDERVARETNEAFGGQNKEEPDCRDEFVYWLPPSCGKIFMLMLDSKLSFPVTFQT